MTQATAAPSTAVTAVTPAATKCELARDTTGKVIKPIGARSEEHTSELQSRENLVCRLLHEKKKNFKVKYEGLRERMKNADPVRLLQPINSALTSVGQRANEIAPHTTFHPLQDRRDLANNSL